MSTTAYVTKFNFGTPEEPNLRPAVFLTAPTNLSTLRSAGKVLTVMVSEGVTAEAFLSGVREIERQISLSPFNDVVGEVVVNSAS